MEKAPYLGRDIIPQSLKKAGNAEGVIDHFEGTCFGARTTARGAKLFKTMIDEGDTIWLGIAGAGIVGGLGGVVIDLIEQGFVDAICSTGAQAYHDQHFAWGLPVKQIDPVKVNDTCLREHGVVRIYDIVVSENDTLIAQDDILRQFVRDSKERLIQREISTSEFLHVLGEYDLEKAPHPERSFVATAAKYDVPVFLDSSSNHAIGEDLVSSLWKDGINVRFSHHLDLIFSAAIVYCAKSTGYFLLGGGGPRNFIQTTGPTISQNLQIPFEGADRGLLITTAPVWDGGLSGSTTEEAISWGKYKIRKQTSTPSAEPPHSEKLVRIDSDYAHVFPPISLYALNKCQPREPKKIYTKMPEFYNALGAAYEKVHGRKIADVFDFTKAPIC